MRKIIFITGVSGSGKTTIAQLLSHRLEIPYIDADDYHSQESIQKMKAGTPLSDIDRKPWLERLNFEAVNSNQLIIACSALKEDYRCQLSKGLATEEYYFFHLQGSFDLILKRIQERHDHFMPHSLLKSQFESYEYPTQGLIMDINQSEDLLLNEVLDIVEQKSDFGIIGLGVMGTSIARNIANKGYLLSMFNRHIKGKEEDVAKSKKKQFNELSSAKPFDDLHRFVQSLQRPRAILLMINAGEPVDIIIEELSSLLEPGDMIMDGGNSHYDNTQRRFDTLKKREIRFMGCGISGGEQGALLGPSIMVGGDIQGYLNVQKILEHIAAKAPTGGKCCSFIGEGGAGHFVKMVHNGIEYAEMQLIAEVYSILRYGLGYDVDVVASTFKQWAAEGCGSYLLEITINILQERDNQGHLILDKILDEAENKGTGSWTTISAAKLGVPIPSLTAALYARYQSSFKDERIKKSKHFNTVIREIDLDLLHLKKLYQFGRIMNHHQGIELINAASIEYDWKINLNNLFQVWSAGCIIRSELLEQIRTALDFDDFIYHEIFSTFLNESIQTIITCKSLITTSGLPTPCISAGLDYYQTLIQKETNANLIQAQRDYFGSHSFKLKDNPENGNIHHTWE